MGLQEGKEKLRNIKVARLEQWSDPVSYATLDDVLMEAFAEGEPKRKLYLDEMLEKFQGDANFEAEGIILALEEALIKIKQRNGEDVAGIDYIKDKLEVRE